MEGRTGRRGGGLWRSKLSLVCVYLAGSLLGFFLLTGLWCSGLAVEGVVEVGSLVAGELVWLSNGAKGFMMGRLEA